MVVKVKLSDIKSGEEYLVNEAAYLAQLPRYMEAEKKKVCRATYSNFGFSENLLMT